jgi:hypothetical protein
MKFFREITADAPYPLHVYMLSDSKEFMYGYVKQGTVELKQFKERYQFGTRGRKFTEVPNVYGYTEAPLINTTDRWEVAGSTGNRYIVERENGVLKCSCSGFQFKRKCKHTQVTA